MDRAVENKGGGFVEGRKIDGKVNWSSLEALIDPLGTRKDFEYEEGELIPHDKVGGNMQCSETNMLLVHPHMQAQDVVQTLTKCDAFGPVEMGYIKLLGL